MSETELEVGSTEDVEGIKLTDRHVLESVSHTHTVPCCSPQFHVWQLLQETPAPFTLPSYLTYTYSYTLLSSYFIKQKMKTILIKLEIVYCIQGRRLYK